MSSPEQERAGAVDELPPALSSMWRLCRLGFRYEPTLMGVSFVLALLAAHEQRYAASMARIRSTFDDRAMWARYDETFAWMNGRGPAERPDCETLPPHYKPPVRLFRLLPPCQRQSERPDQRRDGDHIKRQQHGRQYHCCRMFLLQ